jgi:adenylosuccinate lyase
MFIHPLIDRYATREMIKVFSQEKRFSTWRQLWVALAEGEMELGLPITQDQIEELKSHRDDLNLDVAKKYEEELRHDVMAHIKAYGDQCPQAGGIIHLGATSCFVTDNTDVILMREALEILLVKVANVLNNLSEFADRYKGLPTLGYTHFQPAQPTTVGKRAALWAQDFLLDLKEMEDVKANLRFRGVKGTTGTQDSFLKLFEGNGEKVKALDARVTKKMGFHKAFLITGQTYTRKQDSRVIYALAGLAQSAHKMATDLRLLQHLEEVEEPFGKKQVGSSAMPYKRNPMRCERICALSRFLLSMGENLPYTAANQWMERTLDDSANRRMVIPEAFLTADAILELSIDVTSGLMVYPKVIESHLREELPFMAAEEVMMEAVKKGGDRQAIHERIRSYAMDAARVVKEGQPNPFLDLVAADPTFGLEKRELEEVLDPKRFIGRAPQQVEEFLEEELYPALEPYGERLDLKSQVRV